MNSINWSQLFQHRKAVNKKFGTLWELPIIKRYYEILSSLIKSTALSRQDKPCRLLEIGAGERRLKEKLEKDFPQLRYTSCDIDRSNHHDYYDICDVEGEFDIICMFEIIEHIHPEQAIAMLKHCRLLLAPQGRIIISTPNIYYPPGFLRDATHITPWCYDELGGIIAYSNIKVESIYRVYNDPLLKKIIRRYLAYPLFRILRVDYAKQIIAVGIKH